MTTTNPVVAPLPTVRVVAAGMFPEVSEVNAAGLVQVNVEGALLSTESRHDSYAVEAANPVPVRVTTVPTGPPIGLRAIAGFTVNVALAKPVPSLAWTV